MEYFAYLNVTTILTSAGIHLLIVVSLSQKEPFKVLYN
jgi:hypothetical protein